MIDVHVQPFSEQREMYVNDLYEPQTTESVHQQLTFFRNLHLHTEPHTGFLGDAAKATGV